MPPAPVIRMIEATGAEGRVGDPLQVASLAALSDSQHDQCDQHGDEQGDGCLAEHPDDLDDGVLAIDDTLLPPGY